jgi:hypothetical protein
VNAAAIHIWLVLCWNETEHEVLLKADVFMPFASYLKQAMIISLLRQEQASCMVVAFMHVRYFTMANCCWNCSCKDEEPSE